MQILSTVDPRDSLEKARHRELVQFAKAHGVDDVRPDMPAKLIRIKLRARGLINIRIPPGRVLGSSQQDGTGLEKKYRSGLLASNGQHPQSKSVELDEAADLERQYRQAAPAPPDKPIDELNITELRKECTRRGIPMERTDNMTSLKAKLHGKNAAQRDE